MMGLYYITNCKEDPSEFLKKEFPLHYSNYWANCDDISERLTITNDMDLTSIDGMMIELKKILESGKPAIIGGNKDYGNIYKDHYALVVGYVNNGTKRSDFIVLDPWHSRNIVTTLYDFYNDEWYPNPAAQLDNLYTIRVFK